MVTDKIDGFYGGMVMLQILDEKDTGAKYTCCDCSFVDRAMNENMLSNCDVKLIG